MSKRKKPKDILKIKWPINSPNLYLLKTYEIIKKVC